MIKFFFNNSNMGCNVSINKYTIEKKNKKFSCRGVLFNTENVRYYSRRNVVKKTKREMKTIFKILQLYKINQFPFMRAFDFYFLPHRVQEVKWIPIYTAKYWDGGQPGAPRLEDLEYYDLVKKIWYDYLVAENTDYIADIEAKEDWEWKENWKPMYYKIMNRYAELRARESLRELRTYTDIATRIENIRTRRSAMHMMWLIKERVLREVLTKIKRDYIRWWGKKCFELSDAALAYVYELELSQEDRIAKSNQLDKMLNISGRGLYVGNHLMRVCRMEGTWWAISSGIKEKKRFKVWPRPQVYSYKWKFFVYSRKILCFFISHKWGYYKYLYKYKRPKNILYMENGFKYLIALYFRIAKEKRVWKKILQKYSNYSVFKTFSSYANPWEINENPRYGDSWNNDEKY